MVKPRFSYSNATFKITPASSQKNSKYTTKQDIFSGYNGKTRNNNLLIQFTFTLIKLFSFLFFSFLSGESAKVVKNKERHQSGIILTRNTKLFSNWSIKLDFIIRQNLSKETSFLGEILRRIINEIKEHWLSNQAKQTFLCVRYFTSLLKKNKLVKNT